MSEPSQQSFYFSITMRFIAIFILLLCQFDLLHAQSKNADCLTALLWTGQKVTVSSVDGPGNKVEFSGYEMGNEMYMAEEKNSVWIRFIAPTEGELTIDLVPDDPNDDWDFMLFKAQVNQCDMIGNGMIKPVRSNLARNDHEHGGRTGLDLKSEQDYVGAGVNPNFSKWLEVKKDEHFFLVVNINENTGNGFKLDIKVTPFASDEFVDMTGDEDSFGFVDMTETAVDENNITMQFQFYDRQSKEPISCDVEIKGVNWSHDDQHHSGKTILDASVPADKYFYINVKKTGYTFSSEKYKATENENGSIHKIYVAPMKTGSHIVLEEIVFRENTVQMLPTSIIALDQLIAFMNENPSAKIEIQGHVNAPNMENSGKVKKFSFKRAEQIKQYLVDAGIEGQRIEVQGMGNEFMIYPNPTNYNQEKANRRVEIEILSL